MARIRIEVSFENPIVFAGETLNAIVSFKNVGDHANSIANNNEVKRNRSNTNDHERLVANNLPTSNHGPRPSVSINRNQHPDDNKEGLLMGYVQLQGYFELDNSINKESFASLRKHGAMVGKTGLGYSNNNGGFFKGLTNFLHVNENKSEDERYPILSTPQSLLFVDLKLQPGETKSFGYSIQLPTTLPPTCRNKLIKIQYVMAIGTQKLDFKGRPAPRIIHAPFRIYPNVDPEGEMPIHDLKKPIVLQEDLAIITPFDNRRPSIKSISKIKPKVSQSTYQQQEQDFLIYIDQLLKDQQPIDPQQQEQQQPLMMISPTMVRQNSVVPQPFNLNSCRENIDYFVKYNYMTDDKMYKVIFQIAQSGKYVASVSLSKPIYRVGEDISIKIDFTDSKINCYHVTASLETFEKIIDQSLNTENNSTTSKKRAYAQLQTSTFSTLNTHFDLTIPVTGTPQFVTSCITMHWSVRLDFVTCKHINLLQPDFHNTSNFGKNFEPNDQLECDLLSVQLPLTVYPTNQDMSAMTDLSSRRFLI